MSAVETNDARKYIAWGGMLEHVMFVFVFVFVLRCLLSRFIYFNTNFTFGSIYKVVQIWPGQTVTCLHTISPGHNWTTLYFGKYINKHKMLPFLHF
jgi:hypothetical protein